MPGHNRFRDPAHGYAGAVTGMCQGLVRWLVLVMAALAGLLALGAPAQAQTAPGPYGAPTHIAAELLAQGPAVPGQTAWLALHFTPAPGWHGYWSNPGDAGFGMRLDWTLPSGMHIGEPRYPVPETLLVGGLMNHVYTRDYAVLLPLTLPSTARPGERLDLAVKADWLACTDRICVPEGARLAVSVLITATGAVGPGDPRFDTWRAALPAPLGTPARFRIKGDTLRLAVPLPASATLEHPHLFVGPDRVIDYAAPQLFARKGDQLLVTLKRPRLAPLAPTELNAVLRLDAAGNGVSLDASPGAVPSGGVPLADGEGAAPPLSSLPLLLLAALAGGLLLNVMPCVFPILSLKALSLARAGESEAEARAEGLAYSAGVVVACASLGALLLALRAAGEQVGWAFQLQEPGVVAALLLLAVAITANLAGLYEVMVPGFAARGAGASRSAFATGLLAAFVATPCTGPFMAGAMGAALLLPVAAGMALFVALGFGIALPFLAVACVPALRRRLPRPGAWMVWFRRLMAVPMGLTALALLWLASRVGGWSLAGSSAICGLILLILLALLGARQRRGGSGGVSLALLIGLAASAFVVLPRTVHAPSAATPDVVPSRPFSEPALADARAGGKPVFAYFTADWCLTCKVNERVAIERAETRDAFAKAHVTVLKGDWTRRDPAITRYLTRMGAAGVPLYVWYPADGSGPRVLPQVLGPDSLPALTRP